MKKYLKSCKFNIDSGCVEVKFSNGTILSIDCTAVENELTNNIRQCSELDYLIYNKPIEYVKLVLNGEMKKYLDL